MNILFPCHPINKKEVDPEFNDEALVCNILGFKYSLFDYDMFVKSGKVNDKIHEGDTIYRGWMLKPCDYEKFYQVLDTQGVRLINNVSQYDNMHNYQRAYHNLDGISVHSLFQQEPDHESFLEDFRSHNIWNGSVFVKDYIKSAAEYKNSSVIQNIDDKKTFYAVCSNLKKNRGKDFHGGYCFKPMIKPCVYNKIESIFEHRAFFFKNRLISYSGSDYYTLRKDDNLINKIKQINKKNLNSNFFTVDLIMSPNRNHDEVKMMVLETGDGQVSGLKRAYALTFYENLRTSIFDLA